MTSPMVDTLRNIPLVTEKDTCVPMEAENEDSGFPFDREERDDDFRSQLDDIAKRHPEFAEHLDGFPFRSDSLGRRRPPRPEQAEFRRFDRPFGSSRFERFGFPFSRDPFDEDFEEQVPPPQHQEQSQSQPKQQQQQQQQEEEEEEKPKAERSSRKPNIQQSNTVDLGQKQEPVNDRNQRSMSAPPPDNRQRFVSSIHIPINRDGGMGDMGKTQSQPQQPQQQQQEKPVNKPTERVIPIHVEGRDEPVMPKHAGPSFSQPQTERVFGGQPQPERIFGHRPSQFTQFVNREPPRPQQQQAYGYGPQQSQQKFQEVPVQVPKPQQSQQQVPPQPQQQQHQEEPQQEQQQQQQQQPPKPTPIDIIQSIQRDVSELMGQVEKFTGLPRDKQYLYLDEMLTRNLIKLDNVDTQGQENIRQARKEAIKCIEGCIGILDAKAAANVPQEKKPEVEETKPAEEESKTEESQEKMEVEAKEEPKQEEEKKEAAPPAEEKVEEVAGPAPEEKMEVIPEPTPAPVEEAPKEEPKPVSEAENKPQPTDEEMKAVPKEEEECKKEAEASKDEKKKGKKKAVKN